MGVPAALKAIMNEVSTLCMALPWGPGVVCSGSFLHGSGDLGWRGGGVAGRQGGGYSQMLTGVRCGVLDP